MLKSCVFCFVLLTCCSAVRYVPLTPCPKLFNYFESLTLIEIVGAMTFKNDLSGRYDLEVNMSIATVTDKNIHITRTTEEYRVQNGEGIEYYVHFPYNHTFPKLTSITFNGKLHCVGPPEEATAEHGVTSLSARHCFTTKIVDSLKEMSTTTHFVQINNIQNHPECGTNIDYKPQNFSGSGEYPWLVAIFTSYEDGSYNFTCGGSLVSKRHVITAANCMRDNLGFNLAVDDLVIVLGKHNMKNWMRDSTIRGVKDYYVHPAYRKPADADMALLFLDESVTFSLTIKPICLWNEHDEINETGVVTGWGNVESAAHYIPIVTGWGNFENGNLGESKGNCTGDSGGGLVMNTGGIWKLRGIVITLWDPETRLFDVSYAVFTDVPRYTSVVGTEDDEHTLTSVKKRKPPLPYGDFFFILQPM